MFFFLTLGGVMCIFFSGVFDWNLLMESRPTLGLTFSLTICARFHRASLSTPVSLNSTPLTFARLGFTLGSIRWGSKGFDYQVRL